MMLTDGQSMWVMGVIALFMLLAMIAGYWIFCDTRYHKEREQRQRDAKREELEKTEKESLEKVLDVPAPWPSTMGGLSYLQLCAGLEQIEQQPQLPSEEELREAARQRNLRESLKGSGTPAWMKGQEIHRPSRATVYPHGAGSVDISTLNTIALVNAMSGDSGDSNRSSHTPSSCGGGGGSSYSDSGSSSSSDSGGGGGCD